MALPATFPAPPKPPPASVPMTDIAWLQYFESLYYWQVKLRAALS
jgi:hypothetical protein